MMRWLGLLIGLFALLCAWEAQAQQVNVYCNQGGTGLTAWQPAGPNAPCPVATTPSSASITGIAAVKSAALESNHVIKASAGNLYEWSATIGATAGWIVLINLTAAPTAGGAAIAPEKCYVAPANSTIGETFNVPEYFDTGIVLVFTTSACLTNTASTTVFFSGLAK